MTKTVIATPRIDVRISGKGANPVVRKGLADTGADINIMSENWATEQGLKVDTRDKIKVFAADDEKMKIKGSADVELQAL